MVRVKKGTQALQAFSALAGLEKNFQMKIYDDYNEHLCDFLMHDVGTGKYILCIEYYDTKQDGNLTPHPEVVAVMAKWKIYVIKSFLFIGTENDYKMPENIFLASDVMEDLENRKQETVKAFYNNLDVPEEIGTYTKGAKSDARKHLLENPDEDISVYFPDISDSEPNLWAKELCGLADPIGDLKAELEAKKQEWIEAKAYNQAVEQFTKEPGAAEDWELRLSTAMHELKKQKAKNVNVTFCVSGNTATAKTTPDAVLNNLTSELYFTQWEFTSYKEGCILLQTLLGIKPYCKNITKITYGKKEVYRKN